VFSRTSVPAGDRHSTEERGEERRGEERGERRLLVPFTEHTDGCMWRKHGHVTIIIPAWRL
ncbi:hypothetical protein AALO_G00164760, partial [Alosa alosa]